MMRLTTVILIASLMQVSAATFGQRVTLNKANASLFSVLKDIRKQTGYGFYYDPATIPQNQKVSIAVSNATIEETLSDVLKGLDLVYKIDGKIVTIKAKEKPSFLERVAATLAEINVSGRVVDADGRGLPGASVSVKDKGGKAVSTGANGSFYLKGVEEDAVLVVSFIGYVTKEIKAAKELGDVVLELSTSKLDEVQVIAYGTTTQRLSTGNVTTIKADVIEKQPVNNPLLALQGRVPGLFIEQATGFAGTGVKVRIQGQNSYLNGSDPFYVIDGVPYSSQLLPGANLILGNSGGPVGNSSGPVLTGNPLNFINPSDIESIDVLKDADATAIYGSRAANGAILITTKKGTVGDTKVNLNFQFGAGKVSRRVELMNSFQYLEMRKEAFKNDGITDPALGNFGDNDLNGNWNSTRYTDWQKELLGGTAGYQDMNASVSGGSNLTTFLIGAGYHRETNVFPGEFADQKGSLHFNLGNATPNQKFKIQFSGSYLFDHNQMPNYDLTGDALKLAPIAPTLYNKTGSINWEPDASGNSTFFSNPIGYAINKFLDKTTNLTTNMILSYKLLRGLEFKGSLGYTNLSSVSTNKYFLESSAPEFVQYSSRSTVFGNTSNNSWTVEPQLIYNREVGQGKLEILLGTTLMQNKSKATQLLGGNFSNDLVMDDLLSAPLVRPLASLDSKYRYNALFSRVNYNWRDIYILNLTARRDGSSRFGPESQFHNFGAVGAAWVFSNEDFIRNNAGPLSFGKLRGSYGTTGSDQIADYQFLSLYNPLPQEIPYQGIPAYLPNGLTNPNLQWEETKKLQIGVDLGFFKDRVLVNANYYRNHSSNQLSTYSLPLITGFSFITKNQAYKIRNSGWELMLSSTNMLSGSFKWSGNINITVPKTLLVDYPDIMKSSAAFTAIIGQPLTSIYVYRFLGVNPATGVYQFADKNGNPTSTPTSGIDNTKIMDLAPKYYGGFQNTLSYKNFQIDILFSFVKQIAQSYSFGRLGPPVPGTFYSGLGNQPVSVLSRWQKPGDVTSVQRFTTGYELDQSLNDVYQSDASWKDASYVRLKNVSFSYVLPENWSKKMHLQSLSLFIQGQNLWTITGYTGLDPETKSSNTLPPLRVITFGFKCGL
ncbi:SusC/RagA family TonB-linked outer membrane protein [Pedobacter panaciterrae]|uniref:SusC/RagA family TonB-linked outer membrane protein n=1 Tax=Pedobacter panaciterrae TaxID=363849 RepID=UPI00155DA075|nr:SusC/RagA family TonB-linked outer membrane protein [Pedobacter panaciterrae]NQX56899.1 SusC/RagA family TonB-linked outer membrane protein [Pedobacter panaciterrae]